MKNKILIYSLAMAAMVATTQANAQTNGDETPEALTEQTVNQNKGWFTGFGAGLNNIFDLENEGLIPYMTLPGLASDIYGGYWFGPVLGARAGYYGISNDVFNVFQNIISVDLLWNASNSLSKQRTNTNFTIIPYARLAVNYLSYTRNGYMVLPGPGAGILLEWRPKKLWSGWRLTLDNKAMANFVPSEKKPGTKHAVYPFAITVGVNYRWPSD